VACPSLVGSAIRDGQIAKPDRLRAGTSSFETFAFSQQQVAAMIRGASIEQSIFLLRKDREVGVKIGYTQFSIGRAKDSDVRIVDFAVSRNHACIEIQRSGFAIRDCGSRNGTRVNGVTISKATHNLSDGDTVTLGRYDFTFLSPASLYKALRRRAL
jgi:pSer/pThr/pTyr-binding forkhead associated (FHA) protein